MTESPLVWIMTPVYNGERYLSECIDSVLAQTYENWEYVVVDNCSTDRTSEIASDYAKRDGRVHVERCHDFLPMLANFNRALRMIPTNAKYCKVVHADDTLFPGCLSRMVDVAERNPSVAIVSSYALWGEEVRHDGVPYPLEVVGGRQVCRETLMGRYYVFGSPTSLLLRASDVRARRSFYNEENIHADTEVCFELLSNADFGFVHEVLTRTRLHDEAMTPVGARIGTSHYGWISMHLKFGRQYLENREYYVRLLYHLRRYAVFLLKSALKLRFLDPRFREHHRQTLRFLVERMTSK